MNKCLEIKKLYNGPDRHYICDLLHLENQFGILKFVLDKEYQVDKLILPKGSVSLGFFWENRPYNIYQWYIGDHPVASYFNISDSTTLTREQFIWRDLFLDILVHSDNHLKILDEKELTVIKNPDVRKYIEKARELIMAKRHEILNEINSIAHSMLNSQNKDS
ncbi:MAG: DUF402 domain-containing protein [Candidatus Marinimicrobia bacterium]|nr:DUF402 domain-containing protein [Candidatus Neomarinimicrobiota bacterium]